MQRARRLAFVAVLAVLAGFAFAGCRAEPGVAAYIGDVKISESRVEELVQDARQAAEADHEAALAAAVATGVLVPPREMAPKRDQVVATLVLTEIFRRLVAERHLQPIPVDSAKVALADNIAPSSTYLPVRVEMHSYYFALIDDVQPVEPTQAELREAYDRARVLSAQDTFEQVAQVLSASRVYQVAVSLRRAIADAVTRYRVVISPRYRPLESPVLELNGVGLVVLELSANADGQR